MSSSFTTNKDLEQPANADYVNNWNVANNNNFSVIDAALGRVATINVTGISTTPNLLNSVLGSPITNPNSQTVGIFQYQCQSLLFTGTITANLVYQIPAGISGTWNVYNVSSGAFTVTIQSAGSVTGGVVLGQAVRMQIVSDGGANYGVTQATTSNSFSFADFKYSGLGIEGNGWRLCYGQTRPRTDPLWVYLVASSLTASWPYGNGNGSTTYTMPDLRGRSLFGLDNMGGSAANRITNAISGIQGSTNGAVGGDQRAQHATITSSSVSVVTESPHVHNITALDVTYTNASGGVTLPLFQPSGNYQTDGATTGLTVATTTTSADNNSGASQNMPPAMMAAIMMYVGA
jgi:hypothetical protein